ncbi:SseB family protein [Nocardioides sp.]|uniref:SseB family protein n=1 Tax=Nocardioides sp. TaxID=35761 RepID=UPI0026211749|nr:SseB family protein [Nocardioides sp.]
MRDRDILAPAFPDDHGDADQALTGALAGLAAGTANAYDVLAALRTARVLVPVVAVLGEMEIDEHGRAHDKTADMATVLITGADGRQALLAFTSLTTMQQWQADARPVAVTARDAARAALQDGATAIVLDLTGPVLFPIEGDDLVALASDWELVRVGEGSAWIRPGAE